MQNNIQITESDYVRLCGLVNSERNLKTEELKNLSFLGAEIKRAERVSAEQIAPDFVTMNTQMEIVDLDTGKPMVVKLVYPKDADFRIGNISVLSPLGAALLGYQAGSVISFEVPKGIKRMEIKRILYQPEANGEYSG
ncbi:MAG: GreA/GreB family elongation factor [Prolixibacteraceae bacterium]|jgi:regulator of nucleoside diphosphate kinase|nr:GreA/GreB family elongation factor [Prolixibacteraceae bacterium]